MGDVKDIWPLVDAGSDSFARFHYQAEVALPYCLYCALGDDIQSVIMEHLEDIAIECEAGWRFIQVKSRNPERNVWKLIDLTKPKGALHSLYRTFQQISGALPSLELILEGAVKPKDLIEKLKHDQDHSDHNLIVSVASGLQIKEEDAKNFLKHVILVKPPIPRESIKSDNLMLMHRHNTSLSHQDVVLIYDRLIAEIERAMRAEPLGVNWPKYVIQPEYATTEQADKITAKRLTRDYIKEIIKPLISPPKQLLKRIIDSTSNTISSLERKLSVGGATDEIIKIARNLHANALNRIFNEESAALYSKEELIEDLNQRLEILAQAKNALHRSSPTPANEIWDDLLTELTANAGSFDRNNIFDSDPMLLLGQICKLSDDCKIYWGTSDA
jgi:hypothetical protein